MYVYKQTEFSPYCLFTVGYYDPKGNWTPESDHDTAEKAAERTAWLNGERHKQDTEKLNNKIS